jgi:long-chain acyl-CoA synthetase
VSDLGWPLRRAERLHGGVAGVRVDGRWLTYRELAGRVGALDLPAGARVGFLGANSLAHFEAWLGVPAAGAVLVSLNFRLAREELEYIARDADLSLLIADAEYGDVARSLGCALADWEELVGGGRKEPLDHDPDTLAAITYTGGTTGRPKGVMLSHGNLLANAQHNLVATAHARDQRWLHVCPMFHVAGTANVLACTWVGAEQVLLPRFEPRAVLDAIERERITHTVLVPTMLQRLLEEPGADSADLSSLRHVQYAASPISPELQRRVLERLPDCDVAQFYGMTEAAPTVSHLTPEDHRQHPERLASMGAPVPGVEVELRGADGARVPRGAPGELWIRGPNIMLGYWQRPEATADALVDGWYRSGDIARADEHGYLYMVDRAKDMIISGGENVYSIEVEAVLADHEAVAEVAVFGIPDARWGEAVHAAVTLRPGSDVDADGLIAHCRGRIARFKTPRSIDLRTEPLPRSGAGKVLKQRLRAPFWEGRERQVG